MDRKSLVERKGLIEKQFNESQELIKSLQAQVVEANTESVKISGEYRLITTLIENFKEKEPKK